MRGAATSDRAAIRCLRRTVAVDAEAARRGEPDPHGAAAGGKGAKPGAGCAAGGASGRGGGDIGEALGEWEAKARAARFRRDAIGDRWDDELTTLKLEVRHKEARECPGLYAALFARTIRRRTRAR